MEEIRKRMTPIYAEYLKHLSNTTFVSFSQSEIKFYGHIFTAKRSKPDPKKIDAIKTVKSSQCANEVKSATIGIGRSKCLSMSL